MGSLSLSLSLSLSRISLNLSGAKLILIILSGCNGGNGSSLIDSFPSGGSNKQTRRNKIKSTQNNKRTTHLVSSFLLIKMYSSCRYYSLIYFCSYPFENTELT